MWKVVNEGCHEEDIGKISNIARGRTYENEAVEQFERISKCQTAKCGFYLLPDDIRYGASPDALGPKGFLLEVKTRAQNSQGPLLTLKGLSHYYTQCQLQLQCTDSQYAILQSYHPETKSSSFFIIPRNNEFWAATKDVLDSLMENRPLFEWSHNDLKDLRNFGNKVKGTRLTFDSLRTFRAYVSKLVLSIPQLKFTE